MDKSDLAIGQKVYLQPSGNQARYCKETQEYEVKKIGRKYLEVWKDQREYTTVKFYLEDLRQVTDYTADWVLYFNKQEILDEQEFNTLEREIKDAFNIWGKSALSLAQLRQIHAIIFPQ